MIPLKCMTFSLSPKALSSDAFLPSLVAERIEAYRSLEIDLTLSALNLMFEEALSLDIEELTISSFLDSLSKRISSIFKS